MTKEERKVMRAERKAVRKEKRKAFREDFKKFIARGNVLDLAIAVVVGGAFGKITTALVSGIIMPFIAMLTGKMDIQNMKIVLVPADDAAGVPESAILYGALIQAILDFLIIAFTIFVIFRIIKKIGQYTAKKLEQGRELLEKIMNDDDKDLKIEEITEEVTTTEAVVEVPAEPELTQPKDNAELLSVLTEIRDLLKEKGENIKEEN